MNDAIGGSKGEHTPEPWTAEGRMVWARPPVSKVVCAMSALQPASGAVEYERPRFGEDHEEIHANAARIVACVNACVGIEDPADLRRERDALTKLRDEFRTAHHAVKAAADEANRTRDAYAAPQSDGARALARNIWDSALAVRVEAEARLNAATAALLATDGFS